MTVKIKIKIREKRKKNIFKETGYFTFIMKA